MSMRSSLSCRRELTQRDVDVLQHLRQITHLIFVRYGASASAFVFMICATFYVAFLRERLLETPRAMRR